MSTVAKRVVVRGRVTGVGFRYATLSEALRYPGLKGYVRNADPGTVECVLQGPEEAVEALVTWLRLGPPGAFVTEHTVSEERVNSAIEGFRIGR